MNFEKELEWTSLHSAVEKEDLQSVKDLLSQNPNVNAKDKYNRTPLSIAASKNNLELVQLLLNEGANINDGFPLHYACEKGHTDVAAHLVKNGAQVNLDRENNYPLLIAASRGHFEITKILTENGADINVVDENKETALHLACDNGNEDIISLLIDSGCNPNAQDKYNLTPLSICLIRQEDRPDLVKLLLEKGASTDWRDDQGGTYLHCLENPESSLELIKHGVDVNAQNNYKETPLYSVSLYRHIECGKVLLQNKADPNIPARGGWTPLHFAAAGGYLDFVEDLLKTGALGNATSVNNIIPLHLAAQKGHLEIVKRLLEHESFIDVPVIDICYIDSDLLYFFIRNDFGDGATPFSLALNNGHVEVCKLLATHGANFDGTTVPEEIRQVEKGTKKIKDWPDNEFFALVRSNNLDEIKNAPEISLQVIDSLGWTLLHHSVAKGFYDMSSTLIKKGLSVDALDKYQRTPLSIAAATNDLTILTLLLDNGADVNSGLALHYAVDNESLDCLKELIGRNCDIDISDNTESKNSVLMKATLKTEIVKILLDNNANPNYTNKWGETPLHQTCKFGDLESTEALISRGANINAINSSKETPLMNACLSAQQDIVKLLLSNNADVNVENNLQRTALHLAVEANCEGAVLDLLSAGASVNVCNDLEETPLFPAAENLTIMRALIENGADVNHATSGGWTPLHESAIEGNLECVRELVQHGANVNCASAEFVLPIYLASVEGHVAIVKELLDNGSYVDPYILGIGTIRDDSGNYPLSDRYHIVAGNTPLIGAASKDRLEVVKLLCMSGASLNLVNYRGNTALHEAVIRSFGQTAEFLLSLNVDLTIKNQDEKTALDLAVERSNEDLAQLIRGKI